ncbi:hypothetical protein C8Q76DRAFT_605379 [Earliella scabrosa]|nr:hypothetical protein C8Q76DRAFT_605379 [Earliella scabrosa]
MPPELWLEIFRYATHVPRSRPVVPGDPFAPERPVDFARDLNSPTQAMRTKCALVQVCRAWRTMTTELLYEHVVIGSARRLEMFCRTVRESRKGAGEGLDGVAGTEEGLGHGRWVRHLEVQRWARRNRAFCYWQSIIYAVSFCPRLRAFSGVWQEPLPDGFLPILVRYLPPGLQEVHWQQDSVLIASKELPILTTPVLATFPTLRALDLRKICVLDAERSLLHVSFDSLTLPHVQYLALPTCPLLLRYASLQNMPRLNYLALDASGASRTVEATLATKELMKFLNKHGPQLKTVELLPSNTQSRRPGPICISVFLSPTACPNLETLPPAAPTILNLERYGAGVASLPLLDEPHPTLRRIGIRGGDVGKLYPNRPTHAQAHLEALVAYRAFLPALEVVRTLGCLVGASSDSLAPDVFVWWTERFERLGVDLQDGEGVVWLLEEPGVPTADASQQGQVQDGDKVKADGDMKVAAGVMSVQEAVSAGIVVEAAPC